MLSLTPAKPVKVSDIFLSKEQINSQTPGNLLHTFFTNVRPPKKVLEDQLTQVLKEKHYGSLSYLQPSSFIFDCDNTSNLKICTFLFIQILRKYGTPKPNKNKYNKAGKEQHQGKVVSTKRPITKPLTKEKSVLNSVRWVIFLQNLIWHMCEKKKLLTSELNIFYLFPELRWVRRKLS